jgi:branched-subunit amino acid transport protein
MGILIIGMAAVTFLTRFGAQLLFRHMGKPDKVDRWLKHVPTGILTALIIPPILMPKGQMDISLHNNYLLAGILAAFIAYRFRNTVVTMIVGLTTVVILRWLVI